MIETIRDESQYWVIPKTASADYYSQCHQIYGRLLDFCRENNVLFATYHDFWFEDLTTKDIMLRYSHELKRMIVGPRERRERFYYADTQEAEY